jgi:hypothetical protein
MIDQCHSVAGVPRSGGFRGKVLVRSAGTKRIGGHEEQHHASMGKCRLRQGTYHETRRGSPTSPRSSLPITFDW